MTEGRKRKSLREAVTHARSQGHEPGAYYKDDANYSKVNENYIDSPLYNTTSYSIPLPLEVLH